MKLGILVLGGINERPCFVTLTCNQALTSSKFSSGDGWAHTRRHRSQVSRHMSRQEFHTLPNLLHQRSRKLLKIPHCTLRHSLWLQQGDESTERSNWNQFCAASFLHSGSRWTWFIMASSVQFADYQQSCSPAVQLELVALLLEATA